MMGNNKLKNAPIVTAFVFDNTDDRLLEIDGTHAVETCLAQAIPECMQHAVLINGICDLRMVVYEFPTLDSIPQPSLENCDRYYRDLLLPAVDRLGLKPCVELHTQEIVFALLNDLPINLNKPDNAIRHRSEYAEHCKSFKGGFFDLMKKETTIVLPSGKEVCFGFSSSSLQGLGVISDLKRKTPAKEDKSPKHRIL